MKNPIYLSILIIVFVLSTTGAVSFAMDNAGTGDTKHLDVIEGKVYLEMEDVIVTATRTIKANFELPYSVYRINADLLETLEQRSTIPDALKIIPGVMAQKTAAGQGSPFIRGFTGFRTLLLIDGIRLNNSVFRDGPNQYWSTVDMFSATHMELAKGPSSVLYGSDAIGGTVNILTNGFETSEDIGWGGRLFYQHASAMESNIGRVSLQGKLSDRIGFYLGGTLKDYQDVESGGDVGVQPKTGYTDLSGEAKVDFFVTPDSRVTIAHQRDGMDDVWRTHKTIYGISWEGTTIGDEKKRVLDQNRHLSYIQYQMKNIVGFIDAFKCNVSYHVQKEDQFRIKKDDSSDNQGFDVGTLGAFIQAESPSSAGLWTYGMEYYHDSVDSFLDKFKSDGSFNKSEIQGPVADDATYDNAGLFIQNEMPFTDRFHTILGARYNYANADAEKVKDPVSGDPMCLSDNWDTVTGNARMLYWFDPDKHWNFFGGASQGFRAPNLSDLTRLDTARSNEIETAAPGLDPEDFISYECGIKSNYEKGWIQIGCFYTDIDNMIVRTPTGVIIDDNNEVTKKNSGAGFVQGIEAEATVFLHPQFKLFGFVAWNDGRIDGYPTSEPILERDYLDRLMPLTGLLGVQWDSPSKSYWFRGTSTIAGKQDHISASDAEDTQRIPPGGTPGYHVLNIHGGWKFMEWVALTAGIENVTDEDYRIHGSGNNEPGRNFIFGVDFTF